ncbi:MAG TPA: hypothetical protein V6C69_20620 [Trichormus sp.]|jgi:hypothetical protein
MSKFCVYALFAASLLVNLGCQRIEPKPCGAGEDWEPAIKVPYFYCPHQMEGKGWKVSSDGNMRITLEDDGSISITNRKSKRSGIVIVEGNGVFTIRNCSLVHVKEGARVRAYDCNLVRAESGATVDGYDCNEIAYYRGATVNPHGSTQVATMRNRIRTLIDN